MGQKNKDIENYYGDQNYQQAAKDYAELGPLWAEMVFPDDFEAMKALYGWKGMPQNYNSDAQYYSDDKGRGR